MLNEIYIDEDNAVLFRDAETPLGVAITDATGTWSLKDSGLSELATGSMALASGSTYIGTIPKADVASLTEGAAYFVDLTFTSATYGNAFRRLRKIAAFHGT